VQCIPERVKAAAVCTACRDVVETLHHAAAVKGLGEAARSTYGSHDRVREARRTRAAWGHEMVDDLCRWMRRHHEAQAASVEMARRRAHDLPQHEHDSVHLRRRQGVAQLLCAALVTEMEESLVKYTIEAEELFTRGKRADGGGDWDDAMKQSTIGLCRDYCSEGKLATAARRVYSTVGEKNLQTIADFGADVLSGEIPRRPSPPRWFQISWAMESLLRLETWRRTWQLAMTEWTSITLPAVLVGIATVAILHRFMVRR
jgi:hypothetical protein